MDTFKNLKMSTKIGLVISVALCVLALVCEDICLISMFRTQPHTAVLVALRIAVILGALFYVLDGYKKPHGNALRTTYFLFAGFLGSVAISAYNGVNSFFSMFAAIIVAYIAGRLHKIEKNRILLMIAGAALLAGQIFETVHANSTAPLTVIRIFMPLFLFTALAFAYTARYEQHKAAGLEDK